MVLAMAAGVGACAVAPSNGDVRRLSDSGGSEPTADSDARPDSQPRSDSKPPADASVEMNGGIDGPADSAGASPSDASSERRADASPLVGFGGCSLGAQMEADDFSGGLGRWVPELETPAQSAVTIKNGKLDIDSAGGATVWFMPSLEGDLVIEYDVTVVVAGGSNDHLSDLNSFWMASDPANANLFTRHGTFAQYDSLLLYYVGFGGNGNSTTRFRRYDATTNSRPDPLAEYLDAAHLLTANHRYHIQHVVCGGYIAYVVDGTPFFEYQDANPYRSGRFGFRTVDSHESIGNFTVHQLLAH
jgi:Domain of unknown function (DUF6250)